MKTIDTKSLLLGVITTLLFLTLTSGKNASEENELKIFTRGTFLNVYNPKTNTVYEYDYQGYNLKEKVRATYQISADGSSLKIQ